MERSGAAQGLAEGVSPADLQAVLQALAHCLFAPHTAAATRQTADECLKVGALPSCLLGK